MHRGIEATPDRWRLQPLMRQATVSAGQTLPQRAVAAARLRQNMRMVPGTMVA
jgi:hypothetical protein